MAYVAISQALINSVQKSINDLCSKEKDTRPSPPSQEHAQHNDPSIVRLAWGDHLHLRDQMPSEWKVEVNRLNVRIGYAIEGQEREFSTSFTYALNDKLEVPNDTRSHSYYGFDVRGVTEGDYRLTQAARDYVDCMRFYELTDIKWRNVKNQVTDYLNASKSLNEALKLWPALALYVPDQYIDKVNTNVKREKVLSKAEEVLARISTDELTAAAVAAKLT